MPIYEYECTSCHHQFEVLQKISDVPEKKCPQCSKNTATRLVSAAGFQLKGTGWYATDFKNKPKKETKADTPASSESAASEKKPAESKTTASETKKGESN